MHGDYTIFLDWVDGDWPKDSELNDVLSDLREIKPELKPTMVDNAQGYITTVKYVFGLCSEVDALRAVKVLKQAFKGQNVRVEDELPPEHILYLVAAERVYDLVWRYQEPNTTIRMREFEKAIIEEVEGFYKDLSHILPKPSVVKFIGL